MSNPSLCLPGRRVYVLPAGATVASWLAAIALTTLVGCATGGQLAPHWPADGPLAAGSHDASPACPPSMLPPGQSMLPPGAIAQQTMPAMIPNPQAIDPNEFLCNGGDEPPGARARVGDQFAGVEVTDTVARYRTVDGQTQVVASNPVCVYAPRFGSVRRVTGADSGELSLGPQGVALRHGPAKIEVEEPSLAIAGQDQLVRNQRVRGPDAMRARDLGVPVANVLQPARTEDVAAVLANLSLIHRGVIEVDDGPKLQIAALQAITWSVDQEVVVAVAGEAAESVTRDQSAHGLVLYELPNGRLRLVKLADRGDALPGETVTFLLRVDNVGESPLTDVVITDSLTSRLQYIADSQRVVQYLNQPQHGEFQHGHLQNGQAGGSDAAAELSSVAVEADFSTSSNEEQGLQLTWKLNQPLEVGQGVVIEFKCLVR